MSSSRRSVPCLVVLVAAAAALVPSSSSAAPPRTVSGTDLTILCEGAASPGRVELGLDAESDSAGQHTSGFLTVFEGSTAVLVSLEGQGTVVQDDGTLTGSFPLADAADPNELPVGTGDFTVSVTPTGEATTTTERTRVGNAWVKSTATEQAVIGSGTVVLASGEVTVECSGTDVERSVRTMPDAFVQRLDSVSMGDPGPECATVLDDGRVLVVSTSGGTEPYLSVAVSDDEGFVSGEAPVGFVGSELSAVVELRHQDQHLGDAVLSLRVAQVTGTERWELRQQHRTQFFTRMDVLVTGTVQLPTGDPVAVSCAAERTLVREIATSPAGPKPSGPAPVNDAPEGAGVLAPGDRATAQTGGAAAGTEVDDLWCYDLPPWDPGFYPGHTVWYRFTGTGGEVTVDTVGSAFNTVVAVYRVEDGDPARVACVDDDPEPVRSLQAVATVDTVAGAAYLVQVGGLGGEFGLLKIALR